MKSVVRITLEDLSIKNAPLSSIILIVVNSIPLLGVIFFGWDIFEIMFLYWTETAIIGGYNIIKMAMTPGGAKYEMIPFFIIHYGIFMIVHLVFVYVLFSGLSLGEKVPPWDTDNQLFKHLFYPLLTLVFSHGISFFDNYVRKKEYQRTDINILMMRPYGRIVVMHLTLLFGGFLVMILRAPIAGLVLLIVLKTTIDLISHLLERRKFAPLSQQT